ncbi:TonB-dependent receptor [Sulfuricurvum sp.]|uniref:TonB-dependent receptor n=1 Tax=Sulfuricurvum sp. TaxID=2025608 RepID=UPI002627A249|nr:TonB-dependent receptor [Sulfuricurvum sp.]MDD2368520.1 TonB-dependent receptor [Sulfuricurvum sp.]MDD4950320.1 TonB-dependent receptor [Sulfuricurvum sp.]
MKKYIMLSFLSATYLMADGVTLDPIIISATQTETTLQDAPGSVSVLSKEAIDMLPANHLKEVVKSLEGVTAIEHRGLSDINPTVVLRGIPDQSRTMILLDGIPMNTSYTSSASTPYIILPEDLEQIEVIRGPFSSLYGSSAMGGVINYITRMPDIPEYKASIGYGDAFSDGEAQANVTKIYVSAADKISDHLKFKISYGVLSSDGYRSDFVTVSQPKAGYSGFIQEISAPIPSTAQWIVGNAGNRGVNKYDLSTKLLYTPTTKDTLSASYRQSHYHIDYSDPESYITQNSSENTVFSYPGSSSSGLKESKFLQGQNDLTSDLYTIDYHHNFSDSTFDIRYSLLSVRDWYSSAGTTATQNGGSGTITPREAQNTMLHATWQKAMGNSLLLLGGEFKRNTSVSDTDTLLDWRDEDSKTLMTSSSGGKELIIAGFAEIQSDITDTLSTNIGGRFESWSGYDGYVSDANASNMTLNQTYPTKHTDNFSPKVSLNYQARENTTLKTSWGKAFRAPDPVNLYRTYEIAAINRVYMANPDLTPERSESYDFGAEQKTPLNGLFKAYWFHTIIENMISTKPPVLIGGKSYYERINVGKARSQGYELAYTQPLKYDFALNTNYTKTYTKILEDSIEPALIGKRFAGIPENMANVSLSYDNQQFYALLNYNYQSKIYNNSDNSDTVSNVYGSIDSVGIFNSKIGYRINKNIDLNLAITNILNIEYYSYEKAESRAWFAQINLKL